METKRNTEQIEPTMTQPFTSDLIYKHNLHLCLTLEEAQSVRYYVAGKWTSPNRSHIADAGFFHSTADILKAFVNLMVPVSLVAAGIDLGAGKKTIADKLISTFDRAAPTTQAVELKYSAAPVDPFAQLNHEEEQKKANATPKTLGSVVADQSDMNYINVCRVLTKYRFWPAWMQQQNLVRNVGIEQFIADNKARSDKDSMFNAAHEAFKAACKVRAYEEMPLPKFLDSLMNLGHVAVTRAVAEWIEDLGVFAPVERDGEPVEVAVRRELRKLFDEDNKVFRDPARLKEALDALIDPKRFDMVALTDLKPITFEELVASGAFNNREARAVVELAKTL